MTKRLLVLVALLMLPSVVSAQTTWSINPTTGTVILDNVTITDPLMELGVTVDLQLDKQATGGAAQCLQVGSTGLVTKTGSPCGGTGSSPGGADTNVQYNSSGTFAGDASFTFASGSKKVTLFDLIISDQATGGAAQCLQIDTSGNVTKTGSACSTSAGTVTHTGGLTLHAPIIGNGTADIKATAVLTNGQMLIGSTGADPVPAAIGSSTLTITTGAGSLSLDTASIATHQLVIGRGAGPYVGLGTLGTTTTVLHGNAAGDPTFGAVNLSTDVTGVLSVPNGGLGLASGTTGGIPYFTSATTMASSLALTNHAVVIGGGSAQPPHTLVTGTTGQFLQSQGSGSDPIWATAPAVGSAAQGNAAYWTTASTITGDAGIIYVAAFGTTRANIQSAIDAAPSGGIVQFECGTTYTLDGTAISVTKRLELSGCGFAGVTLTNGGASPTMSVNSADPVNIHGFTFSGGILQLVVQGGNAGTIVSENRFTAPSTSSGQTTALVEFISTVPLPTNQWSFRHNILEGPSSITGGTTAVYYLWLNGSSDSCECSVSENTFAGVTSGTQTQLEWAGGGDVRVTNNKFNGIQSGVSNLHLNNTGVDTSEFVIVGNVISTPGPFNISVTQTGGSASMSGVVITGNNINGSSTANIAVNSAKFSELTITGNFFSNSSGLAISLPAANQQAIIDGNHFTGNAGGTGISVGASITQLTVGINQYAGFSANVVNLGTTAVLLKGVDASLANLGSPTVGSFGTCLDCNPATSPCTTGGGGAYAIREGGAWKCL